MKTKSTDELYMRFLIELGECLNEEAAHRLIALKADPALAARLEVLADKCTEGELTIDERAEYDRYIAIGNLAKVLKAQSRAHLAKKSR